MLRPGCRSTLVSVNRAKGLKTVARRLTVGQFVRECPSLSGRGNRDDSQESDRNVSILKPIEAY
jgi:hypothetical protein